MNQCYTCVVMMYACMRCVRDPCTCLRVYGSVHDACWHSVVASWEGHCTRLSIFSSSSIYLIQALLGHSSISTSTSTSESVDLQQQHQQLECVACSSPCSMFPPTQAVTTAVLPACPFSSTCVISCQLHAEGEPCMYACTSAKIRAP